jgi:hypothetical protein
MQGDETEILRKALRGEMSKRDLAMVGLKEDTRQAIKRIIELNPALEEAVLNLADLCYRDGSTTLVVEDLAGVQRQMMEEVAELQHCPICQDKHSPDRIFALTALDTHLIPGHEYIIHTKTSLQKYPRKWRMGFLGAYDRALQFSARGPNRTHGKPYGGTQTIPATTIIGVKEVEAIHAKRYVGVPVK